MYEKMSILRCLLNSTFPSSFIQEALNTCDNVEIRYCAREPQPTHQHASRHRRGSLHSPSPTSPEMEVRACPDPSSPAKAFVKINNNPTNDWKVYYKNKTDSFPVMQWRVDHVQESRPMTGFAFGLAQIQTVTDPANRDKPLRLCHGTLVVTKDGIFVNGYKRTLDVPDNAASGFEDLINVKHGTVFSIDLGTHPKTGKLVTVFMVNDIIVFRAYNNDGHGMVPCGFTLDMYQFLV